MSKIRVLIDAVGRTPTNLGELEFSDEAIRDNGAFFHRRSLSGEVTFINRLTSKDYDYIFTATDSDVCDQVNIKFEQLCAPNDWRTIYEGNITRLDLELLQDRCTLNAEPKIVDKFSCIFDHWEEEINILTEPNPVTVIYRNIPQVEFALEPVFVANKIGFGAPLDPQSSLVPAFDLNCLTPIVANQEYWLYGRIIETSRCNAGIPEPPPPAPTPWVLLTNNCGTNNTTDWYREMVQGVDYSSVLGHVEICTGPVPPPQCTPPALSIPNAIFIDNVDLGDCSYDLYVNTDFLFPEVVLQNGRDLVTVIDFMLAQMGCGLTLHSNLLTDVTNPITATPNTLRDLMIFQKSDIVKAGSSEVATLGEITFKDLITDLSILLNARWDVDSATSEFIFEHVSEFAQALGTDLTTLDGGKWANNRNTISYDDLEVPPEDQYEYANKASNVDFVGFPITYSSNCAKGSAIINRTQQLETEITRIFQNPEEGLTGFVLLQPEALRQEDDKAENGRITGAFRANAPLAWSALHPDYHEYYRPVDKGTVNDAAVTFQSTKPIVEQTEIEFPICCLDDFNPTDLVRTEQGDGENGTVIYNLATKMAKITPKFPL